LLGTLKLLLPEKLALPLAGGAVVTEMPPPMLIPGPIEIAMLSRFNIH